MLRRIRSAARRVPGALRSRFPRTRAVLAAPYRRFGRGLRLRPDRLGFAAQIGIVLLVLAGGLLLAFPLQDVEDRCPARGEGYDFCFVQKALLPSILIVLASLFLAQFVARALLVRLPAWRERVRIIGERRVGEEEARPDPPYRSDPFLLAATWGEKKGPSERRRPRLMDRLPASLLAWIRRRRLPD